MEQQKSDQTILTKAEYARHRGVSPAAVNDKLKKGHLNDAIIRVGRKDKIVLEVADRLWLETTKTNNKNIGTIYKNQDPSMSDAHKSAGTYAKSRAAKEAYQAKITQLKYEKEAGKLVNAKAVKTAASNIGRITRDRLMAMPERLSPILSAEKDIDEIREILFKEIHKALTDITNLDLTSLLEGDENVG